MVDAHYHINSRKFRVVDRDPTKGKLQFKGHSGTNHCGDMNQVGLGPLPTGQYHIYDRGYLHGDYAFVLDPVDDRPLNDRWDHRPDGIQRGAFRIHREFPDAFNYGSKGCIVLKVKHLHRLKHFLDATEPGPVGIVTSPNPDSAGGQDHFTSPLFGVLTVEC